MAKKVASIHSDLTAACKRFEEWRTTRPHRGRIPDELWELATSLAERHGSYRVSKTLRLNYQDLKRRAVSVRSSFPQQKPTSSFVELDLSRSFTPSQCLIELEESKGSKMTIRLMGSSEVDVIALSNAFFGRIQ